MSNIFTYDKNTTTLKIFVVVLPLLLIYLYYIYSWTISAGGELDFVMFLVPLALIICFLFILYRLYFIKYTFGKSQIVLQLLKTKYVYEISELRQIQLVNQTARGRYSPSQSYYKTYDGSPVIVEKGINKKTLVIFRFKNSILPEEGTYLTLFNSMNVNYMALEYRPELLPFIEEYQKYLNTSKQADIINTPK